MSSLSGLHRLPVSPWPEAPHHIISPSVAICASSSLCLLLPPRYGSCGYLGSTQITQGTLPLSASQIYSICSVPSVMEGCTVLGSRNSGVDILGRVVIIQPPCLLCPRLCLTPARPSPLLCVCRVFCSSFTLYRRESSLHNGIFNSGNGVEGIKAAVIVLIS